LYLLDPANPLKKGNEGKYDRINIVVDQALKVDIAIVCTCVAVVFVLF
jgi:hypothetical protein